MATHRRCMQFSGGLNLRLCESAAWKRIADMSGLGIEFWGQGPEKSWQ